MRYYDINGVGKNNEIKYKVINQKGTEISGGEKAEFNLLKELDDAKNYDILLLDEPESSFDNPCVESTT